ncbi:MAG TPA: methyltransferase domain-containing protein, partial [Thermoprotei archaeon]|nr:methyltransferase domain-containing protein [Thermoprotei archaeon]
MDRISKREIEIFLSKIPDFPSPHLSYEQYLISPTIAAKLIWIVETVFNDINGKYVVDLGCGTGRLIIGSLFMNPFYAIGIDIDFHAIKESKNFIRKYLREKYWRIDFICADIHKFFLRKKIDVVIENPPFGVHKKGHDISFLLKAISLGKKVYTIHKYTT